MFDALGQFDDARRAYERAFALDPTAAWALNNLCYARLAGRPPRRRARAVSGRGDDRSGSGRRSQQSGADVRRRRATSRGASQEFHAAGDPAAAEYNLGIVYLANQDYAGAAAAFEDAIKARPAFTEAKARAHAARERLLIGSN